MQTVDLPFRKHDETLFFPTARKQAVSRAKLSLPETPAKYARIVAGLMSTTSPRKRKKPSDLGVFPPKKNLLIQETYNLIQDSLNKLKGNRTTEARKQRQQLLRAS